MKPTRDQQVAAADSMTSALFSSLVGTPAPLVGAPVHPVPAAPVEPTKPERPFRHRAAPSEKLVRHSVQMSEAFRAPIDAIVEKLKEADQRVSFSQVIRLLAGLGLDIVERDGVLERLVNAPSAQWETILREELDGARVFT